MMLRPILTYACPSFSKNLAEWHMKKLQVFQNKMLKIALNLPHRTSTNHIHKQAKIETIKKFMQRITNKFMIKNTN